MNALNGGPMTWRDAAKIARAVGGAAGDAVRARVGYRRLLKSHPELRQLGAGPGQKLADSINEKGVFQSLERRSLLHDSTLINVVATALSRGHRVDKTTLLWAERVGGYFTGLKGVAARQLLGSLAAPSKEAGFMELISQPGSPQAIAASARATAAQARHAPQQAELAGVLEWVTERHKRIKDATLAP